MQIEKDVEATSDDALRANYFNSNKDIKAGMFKVIEQVLGDVVRSVRSDTMAKGKKRSLVQSKLVADNIVHSTPSNMGLIVPIVESVQKMVDRIF